jgi:hypothetical protein
MKYSHCFRNLPEKPRWFSAERKLYTARRPEQVCNNGKLCVFDASEKKRRPLPGYNAPLDFRKFKAWIHGGVNDMQLTFFFQKIKKAPKIS